MQTRRCPARLEDPLIREATDWHRHLASHKAMPRAGGLEDQDALLLDALTLLANETIHIEAADMRARQSDG